jgi:NAD-dependent dihydropyrimidine dehydrogenase PreA subunit
MKYRYLRNGESLQIDASLCTGCGACIEVCPHEVFLIEEKDGHTMASIRDRGDCMECGACAKNCPVKAIAVASGVGCAAAVLQGLRTGKAPECGCDAGSTCCG